MFTSRKAVDASRSLEAGVNAKPLSMTGIHSVIRCSPQVALLSEASLKKLTCLSIIDCVYRSVDMGKRNGEVNKIRDWGLQGKCVCKSRGRYVT